MKMNLATVKPSSILFHCSSTVLRNSYRPNSHLPSVKFPARGVRSKGRLSLRVKALDSYKEEEEDSNSDELPDGTPAKSEPRELSMNFWRETVIFINSLLPRFVQSFLKSQPREVVDEIPITVAILIFSAKLSVFYPPDSMLVKVLARSMYVATIIGYMYRDGPFKREMETALEQLQVEKKEDLPDKAFLMELLSEPMETDAKKYAVLLEGDIKELNRQFDALSDIGQKELTLYFYKDIVPMLTVWVEDVDGYSDDDLITFIKRFPAVSNSFKVQYADHESLVLPLVGMLIIGLGLREKKVDFDIRNIIGFAEKDGRSIARA